MQDHYKYHLVNKEKEKLLSQLCVNQNAFLEALQPEAEKLYNRQRDIVYVDFGDLPSVKDYSARIVFNEIVKIEQYDPKTWNNFLSTVPPENVALRLEVIRNTKQDYCTLSKTRRYCAVWDGRHFFVADLDISYPAIHIDEKELANGTLEVRFKAWDD